MAKSRQRDRTRQPAVAAVAAALMEMLTTGNDRSRLEAARELARFRDPKVEHALERAIQADDLEAVRKEAARSLARLRSRGTSRSSKPKAAASTTSRTEMKKLGPLKKKLTKAAKGDPPSAISIRIRHSIERLARETMLLTGDDPFPAQQLAELFAKEGTCYLERIPPDVVPTLVVVGRKGFIASLIVGAINRGGQDLRVLPQEGFVEEILFNRNWWTDHVDRLNEILEGHEGLQIAESLANAQFRWPNIEAEESSGEDRDARFRESTPLFDLGYNVSHLSSAERWAILVNRAIPDLGLQQVAETIANHIRTRKAMRGGRSRFASAIMEWEHDLARLKREFHVGGTGFRWPGTGR